MWLLQKGSLRRAQNPTTLVYGQIRWSELGSEFFFYEQPSISVTSSGARSEDILSTIAKIFHSQNSQPDLYTVENDCSIALGELGDQIAHCSTLYSGSGTGCRCCTVLTQAAGDTAPPCAASVLFRDLYLGEARSLTFATE